MIIHCISRRRVEHPQSNHTPRRSWPRYRGPRYSPSILLRLYSCTRCSKISHVLVPVHHIPIRASLASTSYQKKHQMQMTGCARAFKLPSLPSPSALARHYNSRLLGRRWKVVRETHALGNPALPLISRWGELAANSVPSFFGLEPPPFYFSVFSGCSGVLFLSTVPSFLLSVKSRKHGFHQQKPDFRQSLMEESCSWCRFSCDFSKYNFSLSQSRTYIET